MAFHPIDRDAWDRAERFEHYFSQVPCFYSMTVDLDVTELKRRGGRFYPAVLYSLAVIVNRHREFRTAINPQGQLSATLAPMTTTPSWAGMTSFRPAIPSSTRTQSPFPAFGQSIPRTLLRFSSAMRRICAFMEEWNLLKPSPTRPQTCSTSP